MDDNYDLDDINDMCRIIAMDDDFLAKIEQFGEQSEAIEEFKVSASERKTRMDDHLQQQLVNELRAVLQPINDKYKDFFHIQLITLCDMKELTCSKCAENEVGQKCMRCVVGYREVEKEEVTSMPGYEEISRIPE